MQLDNFSLMQLGELQEAALAESISINKLIDNYESLKMLKQKIEISQSDFQQVLEKKMSILSNAQNMQNRMQTARLYYNKMESLLSTDLFELISYSVSPHLVDKQYKKLISTIEQYLTYLLSQIAKSEENNKKLNIVIEYFVNKVTWIFELGGQNV